MPFDTTAGPVPGPLSGKPVGANAAIIRLTPTANAPSNTSYSNIRRESAADQTGIAALYRKSFGSMQSDGMPAGPVAYLRAPDAMEDGLCLVAEDKGEIVGTLRFWPVVIGPVNAALLLGPVAVAPGWHTRGLGAQLINLGLGRAREAGHKLVLLVGDAPYYGRFGFARQVTQGLSLANPIEPEKFLGIELVPGAMHGVSGEVRPIYGFEPATMIDARIPLHHTARRRA